MALQITLTFTAAKSFQSDLVANNIPYYSNTLTTYFVEAGPKVNMVIRMVRERFGTGVIKITEFANC
jgi:hypothetical protein